MMDRLTDVQILEQNIGPVKALFFFNQKVLIFFLFLDKNIQYNLNGSNTGGSITVDDSNSFFQSLQNSSNSSRKQIFRDFFLFYHGIVCCVYSLELPQSSLRQF